MRKLHYLLIALLLFSQLSCGPTYVVQGPAPAPAPPPAPEVSFQNFYDALSPYGEWINNPEYGYVWMPNVGPDFKPYATNGNWVYTDEGWTWASNYSWGWAPFHYGRWFYEDGYGWSWIPGNEWAPAWVTWRRSPDYYGWAPLGPSVSMNMAVGGGYNPPSHYWCFVPNQYVTSPHVTNYYVNEQQNVTIISNTTVIHNTTIVNNTYNNTTVVNNNVNNTRVTVNNYAGGPDPGEVSRVTGTQLRPVAVRESNSPGENRTEGGFAIYRPRINAAPQGTGANGGSAVRPAPAHIQNLTNVRPVNTTIYANNRGTVNNTTVNNTTTNNTTINNNSNTSNTNITNNNSNNSNNTTDNNNFHPNPNPGNPGQPTGQPVGQSIGHPGGQPGNQPAGQSGTQLTGQPGNPPASHPNNTRYNGNASTANGNPALSPVTTKPATILTPVRTNNHPPAPGNGNGNVHPSQPGVNGNPPKPHVQQGQKPQDNKPKPDPNNPNNHP